MNFAVLDPSTKVFSFKFGRAIPTHVRFLHPMKVFSAKWPFLPNPRKFSPLKVSPLYSISYVYGGILLANM